MVYTEYFVRGTQPTTECPLHQDRSFMDTLAGLFGKDKGAVPVPVETTGLPAGSTPPAPSSSGTAAAAGGSQQPASAAPAEDAPKKRGFWSRVFGVGKKSDEDKKREDEQKKKPGGR